MQRHVRSAVAGLALLLAALPLAAQEQVPSPLPLHQRIDALLAAESTLSTPILAGEAEFLRRASLDIRGVPPTADELRQFLDDPSPTKRGAAVDRFFADPRSERHLAETLDVWLMERRANSHIPQDEWMAYLVQSVRDAKPWNQLAREILSADGVNGPRAAARFYLDRGSEPNLIARDVGRIFFGRDLQCAQCHDHPLIGDYLMTDYQGLLAAFAGGYEVKVPSGDKEISAYAERGPSDLQFESVLVKGTRHLTAARLPGGHEWDEPVFLPGEEYTVAPADKTVSVPKFSRRLKAAELATGGESQAFNENIANRLWGLMMGRGLVHPVDLHYSENPPAHPGLLPLLAAELRGSGYAIRPFLRELALTQAYQRAWELPADVLAASSRAAEMSPPLEAAQPGLETAATTSTNQLTDALAQYAAAEAALLPAVNELDAARKKYADHLKPVAEANQAVATAQQQLTDKQGIAGSVAEAAAKAQEAAAKLPNDQELAAAAAKFVERSGQLQAEAAALQTALTEKQTAQQTALQTQTTLRTEVEAAQQKAAPLRQAVRSQDQAVVAARKQAAEARTQDNQQRRRLDAVRRLASLRPLEQQIAGQGQVINERNQQLAVAEAQITEYTATLTASRQRLTETTNAQNSAGEALAKVQAEHDRQAKIVASVAVALQSTEAARQGLPEDAVLIETAAKLKTRVDELSAALAAHQPQVDAATQTLAGAQQQVAEAKQGVDAAQGEMTRREQVRATAAAGLDAARQTASQQQTTRQETLAAVVADWSRGTALSDLRPLTPEQMCWSLFQVTGVYERHRVAEVIELDKSAPLSDEAKQDPVQVLAREREIEQRTYDKLKGNVGTFIGLFGAGAGQPQGDFFATADQALYAANAGSVTSWVAAFGGNPADRAQQASDPQQAAEHLYLGLLSRLPTAEETADVAAYLAARPDQRAAAVQELAWGLVTSSEFRFNR